MECNKKIIYKQKQNQMLKNKKIIISLILLITLMAIWPDGFVMAADSQDRSSVNSILMDTAYVLSMVWVFIAMIAGKLMTNEFVYGSVFHLDKYLWMLWNLMKNFANYVIGFVFIFMILKWFFDPKDGTTKVKTMLPSLLVSSVLVQASWFLMWALIDLSTIMTAAVWSLPSSFIEQAGMGNVMVNMPNECVYFNNAKDKSKPARECKWDTNKLLKDIMPTYNSISGPLFYMWYSIFSLHKYNEITDYQKSWNKIALATLLKAVLVIMFIIPILLLMVVNILRIVWIWIWVVFSPFIILDMFLFPKAFNKWILSSVNAKWFKTSNIIGLIFQPVAVVATMSIAVILVSAISSALQSGWTDAQSKQLMEKWLGTKCTSSDTCTLNWFSDDLWVGWFTVKWNFINDTKHVVGWAIGYLMMVSITIFLLWWVLQAGFKTSEITSWIAQSTFQLVGKMAKSAPILPWLPWWVSMANIQSVPGQLASVSNQRVTKAETSIRDEIMSKLWWKGTDITPSDVGELDPILTSYPDLNTQESIYKYFAKLSSAVKKQESVTISSPEFRKAIKNFYDKSSIAKHFWDTFEKAIADPKFVRFIITAINDPSKINSTNLESIGDSWKWNWMSHANWWNFSKSQQGKDKK